MALPVSPQPQSGLTLVELLTILVLVGILSVVVVPRIVSTTEFEAAGFHQEVLAALRYAHKTAIASGCEVQVTIDSAARRFDLFYRSGGTDTSCGGGGFGEAVPHPNGTGAYTRTAASGVAISNDLILTFSGAGAASVSGSVSIDGSPITVTAATGYVR